MNAPFRLAARGVKSSSLPLRFALRELRGGLRGFYIFVACIALGVMAIAGVGSLAVEPVRRSRARRARHPRRRPVVSAQSSARPSPEERAFMQSRGRMSLAATLRAMARTPDGGAPRWSK